MSRILAYCRTSSVEQIAGLEAQIRDLTQFGATEIYQEQRSSVQDRPELNRLLGEATQDDTIAVTKLDRLARSTQHLLQIVADLESRQINLVILSMSGQIVDTRSPTGRLLITMLGAIATFERALMLERQKEGVARARLNGKYKGRPPAPLGKVNDLYALADQGVAIEDAAKYLNMGRATAYRWLKVRGAAHFSEDVEPDPSPKAF